jgi:hypothetical protein
MMVDDDSFQERSVAFLVALDTAMSYLNNKQIINSTKIKMKMK